MVAPQLFEQPSEALKTEALSSYPRFGPSPEGVVKITRRCQVVESVLVVFD